MAEEEKKDGDYWEYKEADGKRRFYPFTHSLSVPTIDARENSTPMEERDTWEENKT